MTRATLGLLAGGLAAAVGCSSDSSKSCPYQCPAGQVCSDGQCVPAGSSCPYGCPAGQTCHNGTCVPATSGCPTACGQTAYCQQNSCQPCPPGMYNCDGDDASCECTAACVGTSCGAAPSCDPTQVSSCGNQSSYCTTAGTCQACPPSTFNCDGDSSNQCECATVCNGTQCVAGNCNPAAANTCGQSQFCADTGFCQSCPPGRLNCDNLNSNQCECEGQCDGSGCKPSSTGKTPCGQHGLECDPATQICVIITDTHENPACEPVPAGCDSDRTCACVAATLCPPPNTCDKGFSPNVVYCYLDGW